MSRQCRAHCRRETHPSTRNHDLCTQDHEHGCPFSSAEWAAVLPALAKHPRVIAPDWLGLGDTEVTAVARPG